MSPTITIPKTKYESLKERARAYEILKRSINRGGFFDVPPVAKAGKIIEAFRKSGVYNKKFLESLKRGLRRSSQFI